MMHFGKSGVKLGISKQKLISKKGKRKLECAQSNKKNRFGIGCVIKKLLACKVGAELLHQPETRSRAFIVQQTGKRNHLRINPIFFTFGGCRWYLK